MQLINGIRPFNPSIDKIACYSGGLAQFLFDGIIRENGLPTFNDHLARVVAYVHTVSKPSRFQAIMLAVGWLHDVVEDTKKLSVKVRLDVYNPFGPDPKREPGTTYINDLFAAAGADGIALCYMLFLMTHKHGMTYQQYVNNIFYPPQNQTQQLQSFSAMFGMPMQDAIELFHICTEIVKIADRRTNTNPGEISKPDMWEKAYSTALDNITQYMPLAEQILIMGPARDSGLYDAVKLRALIKEVYADSIWMCAQRPLTAKVASKVGMNRDAPKLEGYANMIDEIRRDGLRIIPRIKVVSTGVDVKTIANNHCSGVTANKR